MSCDVSRRKISFESTQPDSRISLSCWSYASPSAIAFWKIVGLDVTPTTASSLIIFASLPLCSICLERKSIQTLWPSADSLCKLDSGTGHRPFNVFYLLESFHITLATIEACPEKRGHQVPREGRPDDLGAEAEDVHVVVLNALVSRVDVVADRGANAPQLGGGDRGAHTGAADEDPTLGVPSEDGLADLASLVRIVDPDRIGVGTQVHHGVPGKRVEHGLAQANAPVVECDRHLHDWTVPHRHGLTPGS